MTAAFALFALGCTTVTDDPGNAAGAADAEIVENRIEISYENDFELHVWPTAPGPLRSYVALEGAPEPEGRAIELPLSEHLLEMPAAGKAATGTGTEEAVAAAAPSAGTEDTGTEDTGTEDTGTEPTAEETPRDTAAAEGGESPGSGGSEVEIAGVATEEILETAPLTEYGFDKDALAATSFAVGEYAVTPMEGGVLFSRDGAPVVAKELFRESGEVTVDVLAFDEQLWHGLGAIGHEASLSGLEATIVQEAVYGDQTYLHVPFFFSSAGHALYYNAWTADEVAGDSAGTGRLTYRSTQPFLDGYVWSDPTPKDAVSSFYDYSDSRSLLPRWAFGYIQSRYGYRTQEEAMEIVEGFEERDIPLAALILDLYWFDNMGDFTWDPDAFPDPDELVSFLDERDVRLLTITEPYLTVDSLQYDRFREEDLLVRDGDGGIPQWDSWWVFDSPAGSMMDIFAESIEETLGELYVEMGEDGIDAFWTDLGEPEEIPDSARFGPYDAEDVRNYYNREWSRIIYEAVRDAFPDRRFWILSRSGYTGSAGYNVSVWSGDVRSSFSALAVQPALGLGAGMTGFSYWGSDVGGFESGEQPPERELFLRWMQFGAFSPVFRAHGAHSPREPWIHDDETTAKIRDAIRLRHMMVPYVYSAAWRTYRDGVPIMRPLFFEAPEGGWNDPDAKWMYRNARSYYFGDSLFVQPIVESVSFDATRQVDLPPGRWLDFFTMEEYTEDEIEREYAEDEYPVFIREGGIVPLDQDLDEQVDTVLIVPGQEPGTFTWYHDDGVSTAYKEGEYEAIEIRLDDSGIRFSGVEEAREIELVAPADRAPELFVEREDAARFPGAEFIAAAYQVELEPGETVVEW